MPVQLLDPPMRNTPSLCRASMSGYHKKSQVEIAVHLVPAQAHCVRLQHNHEGKDRAGNSSKHAQADACVDKGAGSSVAGRSAGRSSLTECLDTKRRAGQDLRRSTADDSCRDSGWRGRSGRGAAARPDAGPRGEGTPSASPGCPRVVSVAGNAAGPGAPWPKPTGTTKTARTAPSALATPRTSVPARRSAGETVRVR